MEEIIKAIRLKAELDALRPIDKEREAIILQKFRLDWNYHSNNLEGNSLTYGETKALILFGITAQGKPLKDHFEITGHNEAISWIYDVIKGDYPLTENFIRELHTLLLKQPYEVDAITADGQPTKKKIEIGKYKSIPNHVKTVTGEIFRFATPEETPAMMYDLLNWYNEKKESPDVNPIILAAEFHYKFIRIHPFDDGNGRIARILMNFILMQFGYPPVIVKTEDKANYFAALRLADSGQREKFNEYIASNLNRSLEIMISGAKGESIEEPDDLDKEIALLEKRLKGVENLKKTAKFEDILLEICDNSLRRLSLEFTKQCNKFDKFYERVRFNYEIDYLTIAQDIAFIKQHILSLPRTHRIRLNYRFISFKLNDKDYENFIQFQFFDNMYWVRDSQEEIRITKNYNEQLTDSEIDEIVKSEMKRHTEFIESKIKEIENKNL
ncbi:MAG: Fic family protein [Spirosomaceae bacterium]|jgi:Fic family protein|nr:Fic family protein [Spirosomataceae bacterium]